MTSMNTPDMSSGLPDDRFPLSDDSGLQEAYDCAGVAVSMAMDSQSRGLPTGDPPAWMLWGVEE